MKFRQYTKEVEFALRVVQEASILASRVQKELVGASLTKQDRSPVTAADFAVQAVISRALTQEFPGDLLVAEECADILRTAEGDDVLKKIQTYLPAGFFSNREDLCAWIDRGQALPARRYWTLDPIDGTKGFIRGDQYAVALGLVEDGEVKVGVLGCPKLEDGFFKDSSGSGAMVCAVRGEGAWSRPLHGESWAPMRVSNRRKTEEAIMLRSYERSHVDSPRMRTFTQELGIKQPPRLMDSLAKYAVLAAGEADLLVRFPTADHPHETVWDQAAGSLVVEEAGGRVTDLDGKKLDYSRGRRLTGNRGVFLSNGHLHERALQMISRLESSPLTGGSA